MPHTAAVSQSALSKTSQDMRILISKFKAETTRCYIQLLTSLHRAFKYDFRAFRSRCYPTNFNRGMFKNLIFYLTDFHIAIYMVALCDWIIVEGGGAA